MKYVEEQVNYMKYIKKERVKYIKYILDKWNILKNK